MIKMGKDVGGGEGCDGGGEDEGEEALVGIALRSTSLARAY